LNKYNVLYFNAARLLCYPFASPGKTLLETANDYLCDDLETQFSQLKDKDYNRRLDFMLMDIYDQTGVGFIIVIDEWDSVLRDSYISAQEQKAYINYLRTLLKEQRYVSLAYVTGILPLTKYGGAGLNMFDHDPTVCDGAIYGVHGRRDKRPLREPWR
jgi:hypothetical protein